MQYTPQALSMYIEKYHIRLAQFYTTLIHREEYMGIFSDNIIIVQLVSQPAQPAIMVNCVLLFLQFLWSFWKCPQTIWVTNHQIEVTW